MTITGAQVRAARTLLGWSVMMLAFKIRVSETTIRTFEQGKHRPTPFKVLAIQRTLEAAGIEFDDGAASVRLKKK